MKKKAIYGLIFGVMILASIFVISSIKPEPQVQTSDGINYDSWVAVQVIRADGTAEEPYYSHNTLTISGQNLIKEYLGGAGDKGAVDYIGLCNASASTSCNASTAEHASLFNEYSAGGLSRAQGTYASNYDGNWSIYYTFTATADNLLTNKTGIFNASSGGILFAENTFTLATLQTNDQILINWTMSVA